MTQGALLKQPFGLLLRSYLIPWHLQFETKALGYSQRRGRIKSALFCGLSRNLISGSPPVDFVHFFVAARSRPSYTSFKGVKVSIRNLEKIFKPQRIAVVGASNRPESVGYVILKNLVGSGFQGVIYPVNPKPVSYTHLTLPTN